MPQPPVATKRPHKIEAHGDVRIDEYFWMRKRDDPEVVQYLKAENDYTRQIMAATNETQNVLFGEFKERIQQTDLSVPYRHGPYFYYSRVEEGKDYRLYCRKKGDLDAPEEVFLDVNELAKGKEFYNVSGIDTEPGPPASRLWRGHRWSPYLQDSLSRSRDGPVPAGRDGGRHALHRMGQ